MNIRTGFTRAFCLVSLLLVGCSRPETMVSLKEECLETMYVLVDALLGFQVDDPASPDYGALQCPSCGVLHTRAAEAVYPLTVAYMHSGDDRYLSAARNLGNWLIRQQLPDGAWKETPEEWTGTSTDQLLMMTMAFPILTDSLNEKERISWRNSIRGAADYLVQVMSPDFASINYCATTTASLAMANEYFPDNRYALKARELAVQVLSKMDNEGFIHGEGGRIHGVKYGADVGYEIDMSLWGLALYARLMHDQDVMDAVRKSLQNHLYFIYPNGAIDGSWGIRSNKWTTYGSQTADGCQVLFSMFAEEDPRYRTAAIKNLEYLRTMIKNGLIGYGPHFWDIFSDLPCIYPTFVRAKNLAMAVEVGEQEPGVLEPLPSEETGWFREFQTTDVAVIRSKNFMTTITAYRYKDLQRTYNSKYMHRPTGGSISHFWAADHGLLQLSSQTEYHRWEPMHFPELDDVYCLTPRIEFTNENGYFTNLYEYDGHFSVEPGKGCSLAVVTTSGELSDRNLLPGGVAYSWEHNISDNAMTHQIELRYHGQTPEVDIIEPFVRQEGMTFEMIDPHTVRLEGSAKSFLFEILEGDVYIELGEHDLIYRSVFPSVSVFPVTLTVRKPATGFLNRIRYRLSIH
ncbi:MAG: hypothetical protein JSU77_12025 [Fidelibacterota bacterium]|nr:MAG: hypothetical protein JSU77_12025 [Candidatus Neomarinimicrobiota bacterium]